MYKSAEWLQNRSLERLDVHAKDKEHAPGEPGQWSFSSMRTEGD
jgi:hypothetical protein